MVASDSKHLTEDERAGLYTLPTKYEFIFDGTLGT